MFSVNMMNRHLIAVAQFLVSVGAGFAFGFLGIELMIGDINFGSKLLLGKIKFSNPDKKLLIEYNK